MSRLPKAKNLKIALAQFPGSNCDADCLHVMKKFYDLDLIKVWHTDPLPLGLDGVIVPGGFSYGDYLRSGALASHSPLMASLKERCDQGAAVIGICNGFQILTEAGLLPGVLLRNDKQKFVCKFTSLRVLGDGPSLYHKKLKKYKGLSIPVAHGEGRYYAQSSQLESLKAKGQVLFQYVNAGGDLDASANPNGATEAIAGITDASGRVMGMMPHPERACDPLLQGGEDGLLIWDAFLESML